MADLMRGSPSGSAAPLPCKRSGIPPSPLLALAIHPRQRLLLFKLPPVSMAASSAAWAAANSARGSRLCSSCLQHRGGQWRMELLYRLLEPLVVPLEPLLLAAGIASGHPQRRCHCGASLTAAAAHVSSQGA